MDSSRYNKSEGFYVSLEESTLKQFGTSKHI